MEQIRLGLIGCGVMSRDSHSNGLKDIKNDCVVTAICDKRLYRAEQMYEALGGKEYGDVLITEEYKEMVDDVDAVLIALPHQLHYECSMFFLKNNKHVLCEKPLANKEDECLKMVDEAENRGLTLMCAYPVPYWEAVVKLKELLDSKKYGEVFQMSIWTEQYTNPYIRGDGEAAEWCVKKETLGGGQFFSHGCHYVDLLLRFLGKPVSGFHMGTRKGAEWLEGETTSNAVIKFESGALGYHFGTWGARGTSHDYNMQVFTDKGFFEYNHVANKLTYKSTLGPANDTRGIVEWQFMGRGKQTEHELLHFIDCLRNHKKPLTDGKSSIQSLRCIWRMYEAEATNTIADLTGLGIDQ